MEKREISKLINLVKKLENTNKKEDIISLMNKMIKEKRYTDAVILLKEANASGKVKQKTIEKKENKKTKKSAKTTVDLTDNDNNSSKTEKKEEEQNEEIIKEKESSIKEEKDNETKIENKEIIKSVSASEIDKYNKEEINEEIDKIKTEEVEKSNTSEDSLYPEELRNNKLESIFIGLLLENPKSISMYYIKYDDCYFDDKELLNIYKSILFTEGGSYTPQVAKDNFNFAKITYETTRLKEALKKAVKGKDDEQEKIYTDLMKLFVIRKNYLNCPIKTLQNKIKDILTYKLYTKMTIDEVKNAVEQITSTEKFKRAILNQNLTDFFVTGNNNLTNGLNLPFKILSTVFKGIRKGETMAYAMPSNSGKSRFTINLAAYIALIHKQKILIISNEMSEEKMRLCLITTILNNPEIQKLHKQKLSKTEGELLEFKFRPDKGIEVKTDKDGFIEKEANETQSEFAERLTQISDEYNQTIKVTDWINKEINNSIYFVNLTNHTNDELEKIILNYYYKEKIEYIFYDTLKTDTANIGNEAEIKRTTTILSNLAQNLNIFIASSLQLSENNTPPINLNINDLAVSRTVKEVLDTLCLIKQIHRDNLDDYEYSFNEVDTKYFNLEKFKDPDVRYYACVVDKNRAGAKPTVLFRLNLAYNSWEELGYLRLK